ncbi:MAG: hypothetical protein JWP40_2482, partial [Blastococcus sp.]|nr:hypothetical protein [Blastococcus sp.]
SDPAALGIAGIFSSQTPSGKIFERFYRKGSVDSDELIEAARVEQGNASAEGHAALYCLIGCPSPGGARHLLTGTPAPYVP